MRSEEERKPERLMEAYPGYAIWRVPVELLREQDKNAQVMSTTHFDRLTANIRKEMALETVPLCVLKNNKAGNQEFHILSGHHRVRAARKAGILNIICFVIEKPLSRSQERAKQIAHNALVGFSDPQILREIWVEIEDIEAKTESGLDEDDLEKLAKSVSLDEIKVDLDYELISILFLSRQMRDLEEVFTNVALDDATEILIADKADFEKFAEQAREISKKENIRNVSAIIARMLEIVKEYYEKQRESEKLPKA